MVLDSTSTAPDLADQVNSAAEEDLREFLAACCDVPAWVDLVVRGRPYADGDEVLQVADRAARRFGADDLDRALAAHPRIGEKAAGDSAEARWSRSEQLSVSGDDVTAAELADANRRYEDRFGRVFLICASGLSADQILASARERLTNDPAAETAVAADELRKIALVRLAKGPTT